MQRIRRIVPVRVGLTLLAVLVVVFNVVATHLWGEAIPSDIMLAVIGLVGAAIAGDTIRPSEMAKAPPTSPVDPALVKRVTDLAARLTPARPAAPPAPPAPPEAPEAPGAPRGE